jgi:hypothetical protein
VSFGFEPFGSLRIGGKKDLEGRSGRDLRIELSGRAGGRLEPMSRAPLEERFQLVDHFSEVRRHRNERLRRAHRCAEQA